MSEVIRKLIPGSGKYIDKFWNAILFRASDPNHLIQTPPQFKHYTGVPEIKGYRHPSPGSMPPVNVQNVNDASEYWDNDNYPRDTANYDAPEDLYVNSNSQLHVEIKKLKLGSPGQKNPAVARYDPSGLRSSMTTNWPALDAAMKQFAPTHFVEPEWARDVRVATDEEGKEVILRGLDAINQELEEKGVPPRMGRRYRAKPLIPIEAVW